MIQSGGTNPGQPIRTFDEYFEKKVWKLVMENVSKQKRNNGQLVYVVENVDDLILQIMMFIEDGK